MFTKFCQKISKPLRDLQTVTHFQLLNKGKLKGRKKYKPISLTRTHLNKQQVQHEDIKKSFWKFKFSSSKFLLYLFYFPLIEQVIRIWRLYLSLPGIINKPFHCANFLLFVQMPLRFSSIFMHKIISIYLCFCPFSKFLKFHKIKIGVHKIKQKGNSV